MSQTNPTIAVGSPFAPRPQITHVVFDFDGTLSWLRHGWPELMAGLFLKRVPAEAHPGLHELILNDILSLNGKSSIYQMERCASRIAQLGGGSLDPEEMLLEYQSLLRAAVEERTSEIARARAPQDTYLVYGARALLEKLHERGLVLIILSGTAEPQVKEEARLLGVAKFFGDHIYGGTANLQQSSKAAVIQRLMHQEKMSGEQLLSFGDGPVEIRLTKEAGGLAVGVASDEDENGSGQLHPQKTVQLRDAGADLFIPDYRDPDKLLMALLGNPIIKPR